MGAKYFIRVPRQVQLERINSSNGQIRVEDIQGNAHLETSNGGIRLRQFEGRLDARTSNGPVEADSIGGVVDTVPNEVCGLDVSALVIVDGGDDGTEAVARSRGAYACVAPANRGQGAALRLGYRVALDHGARYVATLDADGQYDPAELPTLVQPLVDDEADLVTGSRRLGSNTVGDPVR